MEENVFRVNFPSKVELVRVHHFGRFHVLDSSIVLLFDFWKKKIQPAWIPEDVWVRVYGLPPVALDDYLALWALGDIFGKTKDIDINFTRQNNVLRMLITCLDTTLIPDTWDLKIKHEFFRLRFEVEGEQSTNTPDVTMSEAPGDGGDDDPNLHDKSGGADVDRNVKRTKNTGEKNDEKGEANSHQNLNAKSADMHVSKIGVVGVEGDMIKMVSVSKSTPRYDDVLFSSYKACISPKHLFSPFSAVAEEVYEYVPITPLTTPSLVPVEKPNVVYESKKLSAGKSAVQLMTIASMSITPEVHAARTPGHAATDKPIGVARTPGQRPAASSGPATPVVTGGPTTPLGGKHSCGSALSTWIWQRHACAQSDTDVHDDQVDQAC
jgi:hypothetical protein